jgi:hypothetical protein
VPDIVADTLESEPGRPLRPPPRWVVVLAAAALAVAAVTALVLDRDREGPSATPEPATSQPQPIPRNPIIVPPRHPVPSPQAVGLLVMGVGSTLTVHDPAADRGAWTVTLRRPDGSLGRHGAVVTYPAPPGPPGRLVQVGPVTGSMSPRSVTWPLGESHARVRGDLPARDLLAVAEATTLESGRPHVRAPRGLAVVASGPYRSRILRDARYGGVGPPVLAQFLGGLVYTTVCDGAGFEDQLYGRGRPGGTVHGSPAVFSRVGGGNETLAWQLRPGIVAFVGYSGTLQGAEGRRALRALARASVAVNAHQWRVTQPQRLQQPALF